MQKPSLLLLFLLLLSAVRVAAQHSGLDSLRAAGAAALYDGKYNEAFFRFIAMKHDAEQSGDTQGIALSLRYLGETCRASQQFDLGMDYLNQALTMARAIGDSLIAAQTLNRMAAIRYEQRAVEEAGHYARQSLDLSEKLEDGELAASNLNILGALHTGTGDYEQAVSYYLRAMEATIRLPVDKQVDLPNILNNISNNYYLQNKYQEGLPYAKQSFELASANHTLVYMLEASRLLTRGYKSLHEFEKALEFSERTSEINEQFMTELKNAERAVIELQFKNEEANKENILLKQTNAENKQLMKIQERSSFMLLGALVLITALLVGLLWLYRQRKVNMIALREQNNLVMQQSNDLQNLNEVKDRLLSMISHDFRSPLLTLHAMLELVEMGKNSEQEIQELNTKVRRHLQETLSTLDNIIYWSMSQMAGFRLKPEKIHLAEFAEAWLKPLQAEMQSKNITLKLDVNPDHQIESDREVLSLVFRNLLTNAVKFSHAGGTIYVSSAKEEQAMVLSVRDEGIGISDEVLRKLQQQEHVTTLGTNHEKGTGMGLMLSRDLVKKLGGEVHIQREGAIGTQINLILPLAVQSEQTGRQ